VRARVKIPSIFYFDGLIISITQGYMCGWMDGWMEGKMGGQMDGWMGG